MKIKTRCLPLGALPYDNIKTATAMMAKLFIQFPYIPVLYKISSSDSIAKRSFSNLPGLAAADDKIVLKTGTERYERAIAHLEKAFNNPSANNLEPFKFDAVYLEKFLQMIQKFKSPNACVNLLGPFTVSQILKNTASEQILADKKYRKLFIQSVCVKTFWIINKIKELSPNTIPVIILEEPQLANLGNVKRESEDITTEVIINLFARVIEKIHESGALVGIQCFEKCDWSIPIKAGADLISFDAYNNPNNLNIIPEIVSDYLRNGGMINWGIVPTSSEQLVKSLTVDYLYKRLSTTMGDLILSGVPGELVFKNALVSLQGGLDALPAMFAEKAILLAAQLGSRLAAKV